ncbi:MAG: hypothetical protein M1380_04395 [Chloroflexi bacterium]|nr:hypothetical protein [Chloroflexota bacterium]
MSGVDPSRLVSDLRSSLAGLQQAFTPRSRPEKALDLPWEEWLSREESRLDGSDSDVSWPRPVAARSLPELLQFLASSAPSRPWTDALSALKAWGEGLASQPAGRVGAASGRSAGLGSPVAGRQAPEGLVPSQFDPSLSPQEAYAACGPAAAVAFARASGRDLSLREVVELAKTVGWTPVGGMNGVANQKRLLEKIGVPVRLDGSGDWNRVVETASSGQPVTISTPGHYFVADAYDPKTGRFHVGASGTSYRSGKEWMTRQEMEGLAGRINGTLVMDAQRRWTA